MTLISSPNMGERDIVLRPLDILDEDHERLLAKLSAYADRYQLDLSDRQLRACLDHLLYVCQVNEYINLTRIVDLDEALVLHILDSLLLLKYLPVSSGRLLDMGTGAGFPGIPLAICTDLEVTPLDSVGKKVKAVNAFIHQLGLTNAKARHSRLELFAREHSGEYECIVARALASLPVLLEYATPLLSKNGYLVLAKGVPEVDELDSASKVADICGLHLINHEEFDLPNDLGHRSVFVYKRVAKPKVKLPRNPGVARKTPLA